MGATSGAGFTNRVLRVDLTKRSITTEAIEESVLRKSVGGAALGIQIIYNEVPPGVEWKDPENRLFIGTGPLGGTKVEGSGSIAVVTKGALTNGMASSQANGYFGRYLRTAGFDSIVIQGASDKPVYLYIHDGTAELKDDGHLM